MGARSDEIRYGSGEDKLIGTINGIKLYDVLYGRESPENSRALNFAVDLMETYMIGQKLKMVFFNHLTAINKLFYEHSKSQSKRIDWLLLILTPNFLASIRIYVTNFSTTFEGFFMIFIHRLFIQ